MRPPAKLVHIASLLPRTEKHFISESISSHIPNNFLVVNLLYEPVCPLLTQSVINLLYQGCSRFLFWPHTHHYSFAKCMYTKFNVYFFGTIFRFSVLASLIVFLYRVSSK